MCNICGINEAKELDEKWRYIIYRDKARGEAELIDIIPICDNCHLAKHLGLASIKGRYHEAIKWLAKINNIDERAVELYSLIIANTWLKASEIKVWSIKLTYLRDLGYVELANRIERIFNTMLATGNMYAYAGYLYIENPKRVKSKELYDKVQETINKLLTSNVGEITTLIKSELIKEGINVLDAELEYALSLAIKRIKSSEKSTENLLSGKWMIFLPRKLRAQIFKTLWTDIQHDNPPFSIAKTPIGPESRSIILAYIPNFLDIGQVIELYRYLEEKLKAYSLKAKLYFKPDIFTKEGIYSDYRHAMKSYIYSGSI